MADTRALRYPARAQFLLRGQLRVTDDVDEKKQPQQPPSQYVVAEQPPFSPSIRSLTPSDVDSCVALENAAFTNPAHRCTRTKFEYRLSKYSAIISGLFCAVASSQVADLHIETLTAARPISTDRRGEVAVNVLLAHAVATMGKGPVITDADMDWPRDWHHPDVTPVRPLGHPEGGRTVCLHSFAVLPSAQGLGLGTVLMQSYLQTLQNSSLADRVALICEKHLISWYERFGFEYVGLSNAEFGGGGWHDMVLELGQYGRK